MTALRVCLASMFMLLFPLTLRAENYPVGIVADISGPVEAVRVVRGQRSLTPEVGFLILHGDRIAVTAPGIAVTVNLVGQPDQLVIDKDNAAERGLMAINADQTTLVANMLHWLADILPRKHKSQPMMMATRGLAPALVVPIFRPGDQAVATGARDWPVIWQGGAAPYELRLAGAQSLDVLAQKKNLNQPSAILEGVDPTPGRYILEVQGGGRRATQPLIVVAKSALPRIPREIQDLQTTDKFRKLLYITWLSSQDHGKWVFEAMLQANQISRTYPPASRLLRSLQEDVATN